MSLETPITAPAITAKALETADSGQLFAWLLLFVPMRDPAHGGGGWHKRVPWGYSDGTPPHWHAEADSMLLNVDLSEVQCGMTERRANLVYVMLRGQDLDNVRFEVRHVQADRYDRVVGCYRPDIYLATATFGDGSTFVAQGERIEEAMMRAYLSAVVTVEEL